MAKTPMYLPHGKLHPLPVPHRPWSHLGVDFPTNLPLSQGNSCIFVVVDRFSKMLRLIPLKGLPTAMESAELLFQNVCRYFGLPEDIVSDRGPQFISRVWKAFFKLLDVTGSLSSGYHPQTNGQTERKIQEVSRFLRTFCHNHPGPSTHRTHYLNKLQVSLHSSAYSAISRPCFPGLKNPARFHLCSTGSKRARWSGTQLITIYNPPSVVINSMQMPDEPLHQTSRWEIKSGYPLKTSNYPVKS